MASCSSRSGARATIRSYSCCWPPAAAAAAGADDGLKSCIAVFYLPARLSDQPVWLSDHAMLLKMTTRGYLASHQPMTARADRCRKETKHNTANSSMRSKPTDERTHARTHARNCRMRHYAAVGRARAVAVTGRGSYANVERR